jgi:hypothetical protein
MNMTHRPWMTAALLALLLALQAPHSLAQPGTKPKVGLGNPPSEFVVCTGWHALCTASNDCRMTSGDSADCDCMRVNEPHIVLTSGIQDRALKKATMVLCTERHPCDVDEAPVCRAIQEGRYEVRGVRYEWVSTYSYRGWCGLQWNNPVACDTTQRGYVGDTYWTICDAAPCSEIPYPPDPNRPLRCQCPVVSGPFVGPGTCTGTNGGIISSMSLEAWDFQRNTFAVFVPGYDYVRSACAPLRSDPPPSR